MPSTLFYLCKRTIISNNIDISSLPLPLQQCFSDTEWCCKNINTFVSGDVGHLECLKYAYEKERVIEDDVCSLAASNGDLEMLEYACHIIRVISPWVLAEAQYSGSKECVEFLLNGFKTGALRELPPLPNAD